MKRQSILDAILVERLRQERLKRDGKFLYTCADNISDVMRLPILAEEFGEVARAINEGDPENLKEELIQTAAVCLSWLEAL